MIANRDSDSERGPARHDLIRHDSVPTTSSTVCIRSDHVKETVRRYLTMVLGCVIINVWPTRGHEAKVQIKSLYLDKGETMSDAWIPADFLLIPLAIGISMLWERIQSLSKQRKAMAFDRSVMGTLTPYDWEKE